MFDFFESLAATIINLCKFLCSVITYSIMTIELALEGAATLINYVALLPAFCVGFLLAMLGIWIFKVLVGR